MGEAPRARITAQNTLTTWHANRLYGAMVIETLYGDRRAISGEHLFYHDPTYDGEDDGSFS
eukprot:scaffold11965_cov61-Skeletonema_dohrnii-CCMP3373.AAC.1